MTPGAQAICFGHNTWLLKRGEGMTDYIKCGDTEWCQHCARNAPVTPPGVGYLTVNALGRCDYFKAQKEERPDEGKPLAGLDGQAHQGLR